MKNVFGYKDSTIEGMEYDGKRFITAGIPISLRDELYAAMEHETDMEFRSDKLMWATILGGAAFVGFVLALIKVVSAFGGSVADLIASQPLAFYGGIFCAVLWLGLKAFKSARKRSLANDGKVEAAAAALNAVKDRCDSALGVPYDRKKVDIFRLWYEQKSGKAAEPLSLEQDEMKIFREDDDLCISNNENLFVMPISGFTRYVLQKERADMFEWHKDVAYNEGEYSRYDIEFDGDDFYSCRCYALQYSEGLDEFEIVFAEYELPIFKEIVDVPVEEE